MIEFIDYPVDQYKRQKFGRFWRIKALFIIISPSAYTRWATERHMAKRNHHANCRCIVMAVRI